MKWYYHIPFVSWILDFIWEKMNIQAMKRKL